MPTVGGTGRHRRQLPHPGNINQDPRRRVSQQPFTDRNDPARKPQIARNDFPGVIIHAIG
ncbi:hypothetical protein EH165_06065 [Nakamurella antarctica]|uniref:Uncharacterized protein n=1 Tax=Nakamurella antarctica TaxID=1902245 RepID=A0A3G8ZUS7_9ACTN|nr:hypothetical protein [Nakamurella antarctica]AZI57776.1 hypothetical protein EH165_06065 [Nakamurella antarctica]